MSPLVGAYDPVHRVICPYHVRHRSGHGPVGISQRRSRRYCKWPRGSIGTLALPHDQTFAPLVRVLLLGQ